MDVNTLAEGIGKITKARTIIKSKTSEKLVILVTFKFINYLYNYIKSNNNIKI